jgi:hypothetical protein
LLNDISDRQISQAGSKKTREQLPEISTMTGNWKPDGVDGKPLAWLVHFHFNASSGSWKAVLPNATHAKRLTGTYNTKSPLQGVLCRIIPVVRIESAASSVRFEAHPYWEWGLAFVFPGLALFVERGSSGATIDFDPRTGRLESTIDGRAVAQPYVTASLFELTPDSDVWKVDSGQLTYGDATKALTQLINITPVVTTPAGEEKNEE